MSDRIASANRPQDAARDSSEHGRAGILGEFGDVRIGFEIDDERLRRPTQPDGMSTIEAVAAALSLLEGPDVAAPLWALHGELVRRADIMRGRKQQPRTWQSDDAEAAEKELRKTFEAWLSAQNRLDVEAYH